MIDLRNLINLLPYQFKVKDTYKVEGKGLLERFLNICGEYLSEVPVDNIDNILDIIDIDKTPEYYLNYIWEFLGEIPFAYYSIINKEVWDNNYNPFDSPEEYNKKKKLWEIEKTGSITLPTDKVRECLKYALTLMKVRGTKLFFKTLFGIYGLNCVIEDPISSTYKDPFKGVTHDGGNIVKPTTFDDPHIRFDNSTLDNIIGECKQCIPIDVTISISGAEGEIYSDKNGETISDKNGEVLFTVNKFTPSTLNKDIILWLDDYLMGRTDTENYRNFLKFRDTVTLILDKYLPFNVTIGNLNFTY